MHDRVPLAGSEHPSVEDLQAFVQGSLEDAERLRVEAHVESCDSCCQKLRELPPNTQDFRLRNIAGLADETQPHFDTASDNSGLDLPQELVEHPRYRVLDVLGTGGMGVVYRAEHRLMERVVALKVINRRLFTDANVVKRFRLEVKAAARLSHRNIVAAFDAEQAGDLHFLVMEYVAGFNLAQLLKRRQLTVLQACNYVMQAAVGLQHAFEAGMVHRDVKPQNLMRTSKGTVKILDFGLARLAAENDASRLTRAGTALGTVDYIAPEQIEDSHQVDTRADIYSLGCTLYHLLANQVPFPNRSSIDKLVAHIRHQPKPLLEHRPDLPPALGELVQRMMDKDPQRRPQVPAEITAELKQFGRPNRSGKRKEEVGEPRPAPITTAEDRDLAWLDLVEPPPPPIGEPVARSALPRRQEAARRSIDLRRWRGLLISLATLLVGAVLAAVVARGVIGTGVTDSSSTPSSPLEITKIQETTATPETATDSSAAPRELAVVRPEPPVDPTGFEREKQTVVRTEVESGRWTDLLQEFVPSRQPHTGYWEMANGGLLAAAGASAWLAFPDEVPTEYDLEVDFTRRSGIDSIAVFFVAGSGQAAFEVDAWREHLGGIQNIAGEQLQLNATRVDNVQLLNGRRYSIRVEVRSDSVTGYLDGRRLARYVGNGSDLSLVPIWGGPPSGRIALGAYLSETLFHRVRIRSLGSLDE